MPGFDPDSNDATFARIIQRLDQQDVVLNRIEAAVNKTNGRVTQLERWRDVVTAKTALISSAVSAVIGLIVWLVTH